MKTSFFLPATLTLWVCSLVLNAQNSGVQPPTDPAARQGAVDFRAGAAQVDITPPKGTPLAGFYSTRLSAGVLDPIYAKAIVVEQGGEKAAFVALDLTYTTRPLVVAARKLIAEQTGIAPQRVMISATHTHSGPVLARDNLMDDITGVRLPTARDYADKLPGQIARAVADAKARLVPAGASATVGREENLSFNRRYLMKDGSFAWQPPKLSPNILRPAGPIDPDVGVWYVATTDKTPTPLATYVNFAMHPTVIAGVSASPDYPGYLARRLADYLGMNAITFFANGCCGNINQRNPNWADPQSGVREGERVGILLAAAVFRAWPDLQPLTTRAPRARSAMVTLPRREFSDHEVAEARDIVRRMAGGKIDTPTMARAVCILDTLAHRNEPLQVEVQAIAFSDELAIVALPGEIFVELGLSLKKASPFKHTFIAELANGSIGYIPNRRAYPEGLYEVFSARCAEGSGEMLVQEALRLLQEMTAPPERVR